jgi:hypothetical protein
VLFLKNVFGVWKVENTSLPVWKLSPYVCRIEILETLICLMLDLNVETVIPLDAHRRQMP